MRARQTRLKKYYHKPKVVEKDREGGTRDTYGDPSSFFAVIWPASGKLQAEKYGERLNYIRNCKVDGAYSEKVADGKVIYEFGTFSLKEGDGICVCVDADSRPDYKIISIRPYSQLRMELEKL